jgi:hypothetical protein
MTSAAETRLSAALDRIASTVANNVPSWNPSSSTTAAQDASHDEVRPLYTSPRLWPTSRWVGLVAASLVLIAAATIVVAARRSTSAPTAPVPGAPVTGPSAASDAPAATTVAPTTMPPTAPSIPSELYGLTSVPAGFTLTHASTAAGPPPNSQPQVSLQTWVSRDASGSIDGIVRLGASAAISPPTPQSGEIRASPPDGLVVHGQAANDFPIGGGGSAIRWDEAGLTLIVMSWHPDAAAIAEHTVVSAASGISLPDGFLAATYVRADTQLNASISDGITSNLEFVSDDGMLTVSISAQPNTSGDTADTIGWTPGSQPRIVGDKQVWIAASANGSRSALWVDRNSILSIVGPVDETTLLSFIAAITPLTPEQFDALAATAPHDSEQEPAVDAPATSTPS